MAPVMSHQPGTSPFSKLEDVPEEKNICGVWMCHGLGNWELCVPHSLWGGQGCGSRQGSMGTGSAWKAPEAPLGRESSLGYWGDSARQPRSCSRG